MYRHSSGFLALYEIASALLNTASLRISLRTQYSVVDGDRIVLFGLEQ